jgi:hypothetical protein
MISVLPPDLGLPFIAIAFMMISFGLIMMQNYGS